MNTGRYKSYKRADAALQETGYLKAWLSLVSDFTTLQKPVLPQNPVMGDSYKIGTAHAFAAGKEPMSIYVKRETIEAPGESQGEIGSLRMMFTPKIFIMGDGPVTLELVNNILNEDLILFVQDECQDAKFLQFGCDCIPTVVQKNSFTSGTLKSGSKGYELTLETFCKYFYNAVLPERA